MKRLLLFPLLLLAITLNAQAPEQDCVNAIPICGLVYNQPNVYIGSGNVPLEINSSTSCMGAGELNAVWYKLIVTSPGNLSFTLCPLSPTDDYDWGVYNLTSNQCVDIATNVSLEVSCDFSGSLTSNGCTGPNGGANSQDEPVIPVNTNSIYYICVTNFSSTQSGYTLDFSASTCGLDSCLTQIINGVNESPEPLLATTYPNPANNTLNLSLNVLKGNQTYRLHIYNTQGALVKEFSGLKGNSNSVEIAPLSAGLYTYTITTTAGQTAVGRFIKE
jgi:hypothetical protein